MDKHIGRLIRKAREHLKLTVEDVAEELGISADRLLRIEFGEFRPTPYQLLSLCAVLRVQPSWFFPEVWTPDEASLSDGVREGEPKESRHLFSLAESVSDGARGRIELSFPGDIRISVGRDFDETVLRRIVLLLRSV